ncbi:hypothetical protein MTO96_001426 [Rhipicephalus appendiculatus]
MWGKSAGAELFGAQVVCGARRERSLVSPSRARGASVALYAGEAGEAAVAAWLGGAPPDPACLYFQQGGAAAATPSPSGSSLSSSLDEDAMAGDEYSFDLENLEEVVKQEMGAKYAALQPELQQLEHLRRPLVGSTPGTPPDTPPGSTACPASPEFGACMPDDSMMWLSQPPPPPAPHQAPHQAHVRFGHQEPLDLRPQGGPRVAAAAPRPGGPTAPDAPADAHAGHLGRRTADLAVCARTQQATPRVPPAKKWFASSRSVGRSRTAATRRTAGPSAWRRGTSWKAGTASFRPRPTVCVRSWNAPAKNATSTSSSWAPPPAPALSSRSRRHSSSSCRRHHTDSGPARRTSSCDSGRPATAVPPSGRHATKKETVRKAATTPPTNSAPSPGLMPQPASTPKDCTKGGFVPLTTTPLALALLVPCLARRRSKFKEVRVLEAWSMGLQVGGSRDAGQFAINSLRRLDDQFLRFIQQSLFHHLRVFEKPRMVPQMAVTYTASGAPARVKYLFGQSSSALELRLRTFARCGDGGAASRPCNNSASILAFRMLQPHNGRKLT